MKYLADENFNGHILHSLLRRRPGSVIRVQDVGLAAAEDPIILKWAADHGYIVLTHDVRTMPDFAYDRVAAGLVMPGLFEVNDGAAIPVVVDDLILVLECGRPEEYADRVARIPL